MPDGSVGGPGLKVGRLGEPLPPFGVGCEGEIQGDIRVGCFGERVKVAGRGAGEGVSEVVASVRAVAFDPSSVDRGPGLGAQSGGICG